MSGGPESTEPVRVSKRPSPDLEAGKPGVLSAFRISGPSEVFVILITAITIVVVVGVLGVRRCTPTGMILIGGLVLGGILFVSKLWIAGLRRRVSEKVFRSRDDFLESIVHHTLHREFGSALGNIACTEFVKAMAAQDRVGETILLWKKTRCREIARIRDPFEAMLLDESDGAFEELEAALSGDEKLIQEAADRRRQSQGDALGLRRIGRNIRMKGGRWIIIVFGFNVVMQGMEALSQRRVTGTFIFQFLALAIFLVVPYGAMAWKSQQWWVVPGGIAYRWSGLFDRKGRIHLFERRTSVLCIYEGWRHYWLVAVAESTTSVMKYATVKEVNFLLRAWLSPLRPPPVEMLVDLQ